MNRGTAATSFRLAFEDALYDYDVALPPQQASEFITMHVNVSWAPLRIELPDGIVDCSPDDNVTTDAGKVVDCFL